MDYLTLLQLVKAVKNQTKRLHTWRRYFALEGEVRVFTQEVHITSLRCKDLGQFGPLYFRSYLEN